MSVPHCRATRRNAGDPVGALWQVSAIRQKLQAHVDSMEQLRSGSSEQEKHAQRALSKLLAKEMIVAAVRAGGIRGCERRAEAGRAHLTAEIALLQVRSEECYP